MSKVIRSIVALATVGVCAAGSRPPAPLWSSPVGPDCATSASGREPLVLMLCNSEDGLQMSIVRSGGRTTPVRDVDAVLRNAFVTRAPAWAPSGRFVAVEVALDEEPGVLLVDVAGSPSVVFVDKALIPLGVALEHPQWRSSEWLVFRTSGMGADLYKEGIYALRMRDRAIFRLLAFDVREFTVTAQTLYVTGRPVRSTVPARLLAFSFEQLLKGAVAVVGTNPPSAPPLPRQASPAHPPATRAPRMPFARGAG